MVVAVCFAVQGGQAGPQQRGIRVLVPSAGRYVARGFCAFAPGSVPSAESIRLLTVGSACDEVPCAALVVASWFDGSVKLVELGFALEAAQQGPTYFWVEWGPGVRRSSAAPGAFEGPLQVLHFDEAEVPSPAFDLGAGTLLVRVEQHPDLWYYACLIPTAAIMGVLVLRKVKLSR